MTERAKIGEGFRVGKLQVISATERRKNGYTIWLCGCDCVGHFGETNLASNAYGYPHSRKRLLRVIPQAP